MSERLKKIVIEIEKNTQCNCDLDNWQPEIGTGHSWVCDIHKKAVESRNKEAPNLEE